MKTLIPVLLSLFSACGAVEADPIVTLRQELAGLNLAAPEKDAARDLAAGKLRCHSVNSYSRDFPGVTEVKDRAYCGALEVNFEGTSDVIQRKEHGDLISKAFAYTDAYNHTSSKIAKLSPNNALHRTGLALLARPSLASLDAGERGRSAKKDENSSRSNSH